MVVRHVLALFGIACAFFAACSSFAATWHAVPGTEEAEIDLASLRQDATRTVAWLRWPGRPTFLVDAAARTSGLPRVTRTSAEIAFDCRHSTWRRLSTSAYDARGVVVMLSSVQGPVTPVRGEMQWAYDAVCEVARSGSV